MIHKLGELYQAVYSLGKRISKRDHFGIHLKIENLCLETLESIISAAFEKKENKFYLLNSARIKIEVLKRLVRISADSKIIEQKAYINLESRLQEISKMVNGWINYVNK